MVSILWGALVGQSPKSKGFEDAALENPLHQHHCSIWQRGWTRKYEKQVLQVPFLRNEPVNKWYFLKIGTCLVKLWEVPPSPQARSWSVLSTLPNSHAVVAEVHSRSSSRSRNCRSSCRSSGNSCIPNSHDNHWLTRPQAKGWKSWKTGFESSRKNKKNYPLHRSWWRVKVGTRPWWLTLWLALFIWPIIYSDCISIGGGEKKGGRKICDPDFHLEEIFNVKESNKKMKELCWEVLNMKELTHLVAANNPPLWARSYTIAVPNMNVLGLQRNVCSTKHVLQLQVVYQAGTDLY